MFLTPPIPTCFFTLPIPTPWGWVGFETLFSQMKKTCRISHVRGHCAGKQLLCVIRDRRMIFFSLWVISNGEMKVGMNPKGIAWVKMGLQESSALSFPTPSKGCGQRICNYHHWPSRTQTTDWSSLGNIHMYNLTSRLRWALWEKVTRCSSSRSEK